MAPAQAKQERMAAMFMSVASVALAGFAYLGQPAPGEFVEAEPDAYVLFQKILHGAILLLLVFALTRVGKMSEETPGLRLPLLVMVLFGIAGAGYVVALDFSLV